ncbi:tRNA methyltransferase complex GCD14 subunit [Piedraia hortae CBS 480.64]|uniref:tRNA (adenine(58)-N(1))-methyltransferase catalytic subunit TRM61 n=1 Tax=Piedraia hortae CBS 480.64 TaxID=1314780 RepID=A0A6A7C110_9PEZI|nr:tRNA methyltransferase complex GCD14 subunit [Piedraia hortae CBS 480.64]
MEPTNETTTESSDTRPFKRSRFLEPSPLPSAGDLAILHVKRDVITPVILSTSTTTGYAEGAVTNTRFGSFPHSRLLSSPWGSQIRASKVDTGSRGRGKTPTTATEPVDAAAGFIHLLPPTPETWTLSLSHRTQVVYTPDYSYVLGRMEVRPGGRVMEAGAGSGSFTHAAARAVYGPGGRVYSFDFHEPRVEALRKEIEEHGLEEVVEVRERDVCTDGFEPVRNKVEAVFLDMPAPWLAIRHLNRGDATPLDPEVPVQLCVFVPCIEQVTATVETLRTSGWSEVDVVEVQHKRIEVRRERIGIHNEGLRGVNSSPANVDEALTRLREIEKNNVPSKAARLERLRQEASERKVYEDGELVHAPEPELKSHTAYLVFAVLLPHLDEDAEMVSVALELDGN